MFNSNWITVYIAILAILGVAIAINLWKSSIKKKEFNSLFKEVQ